MFQKTTEEGRNSPSSVRERLARAGYVPTPLHGKIPALDKWQKKLEITAGDLNIWSRLYPDATNTGILCRITPSLDIDILHPEAAEAVEDLVRERFEERGRILVRFGNAPKRAIPFRTDEPFKKIFYDVIAPNGIAGRIEFLADGQQLASFGTHPDTRKPYTWTGGIPGEVLREELPYVRQADAKVIIDDIARLLAEEYGFQVVERKTKDGDGQAASTDTADWGGMLNGIHTGAGLHDNIAAMAMSLVKAGMDDGAAINMLRGVVENSTTPHDPRWQERYDDIPRAVASARAKIDAEKARAEAPKPFAFIDVSKWTFENIPEREWAVPDRIPLRQVTLFSGEGAAGKSTVQLHLSAAHVFNRDWLGTMPEPGPAFFIDAEDDESELQRRLACVLHHYGATFADAARKGLYIKSLAGEGAVLATTSKGGIVQPTALYKGLLEQAGDLKPKMIGIASAANVFAGNEIVRPEVQQFVGLLTKIAIAADGAVCLISHPSLTGINTDTGISGSTQWHNSVRARMWLKGQKAQPGEQDDTDARELVFKKNNYGPISDTLVLRWDKGMFLPTPGVHSLDRAAREAREEEVFLKLLKRFTEQNRNVSDRPSKNYAPTLFAAEEEARAEKIHSRGFAEAMRRLFKANRIWNEPYGRSNRESYRLAICK
jgi:RecA-family ATPase